MKTSRGEVFAQLEPPVAGAERLASRLASASGGARGGALRWAAGAAGVAAAALALAALVQVEGRHHRSPPPPGGSLYAAPEFDRLLGRNVEPYKLSVSLNRREVHVVEVPTSDPKIRLYALQE